MPYYVGDLKADPDEENYLHGASSNVACCGTLGRILPIVSIVVPFWGLPFRILNVELVKPKKGTTMETIGMAVTAYGFVLRL